MKLLYMLLFFILLPFQSENHESILYQDSIGLIIEHKSYIVAYDTTRKTTLWVSYRLTKAMVSKQVTKRTDDFREDPLAPNSPSEKDYVGSGYDRGHLANAQDMRFDIISQSESFYMTNMLPQDPKLNRGRWRSLEAVTRRWAYERGEVVVITGAIFATKKPKLIGNNIPVPTHCYKIIYDPKRKEAIAFVFKNEVANESLGYYVTTIDNIEKVTNIDFLYVLDDDLENTIEGKRDYSWFN